MPYAILLFYLVTITFTTDWGDDMYAGMAQGAVLRALPEAHVVALSHHVTPYQIVEAAYVLRESYRHFPPGTVHVLSVNSEGRRTPPVALRFDGHFFVGADNGFAGLLTDTLPDETVRIEKYTADANPSFVALSVLIPAAVDLARGAALSDLGTPCELQVTTHRLLPSLTSSAMRGRVIYIDSYRNVVTNITKEDFTRLQRGRKFEIWIGSSHYRISRISQWYADVPEGELVAIFNTSDYLEVAMNKGFIADMLSLTLQSDVLVKFFD